MFLKYLQYKREYLPAIKGWFFKLFFGSKKLKIGHNFKCDSWPSLWMTDEGKIEIGDNVYFRKDVELRSHKNATIIFEGNNRIDIGVRFLATNDAIVKIGSKTRIGLHSVFNGGDSISLGKNVLISGFVYIQTSNHSFSKEGNIQDQGYIHMPIHIADDAWLAAHVVVLPGINIAQGAVIGSNAVVTKDIIENSINGGVPSKFLKNRYE
jgi:acetyltransferase-like isoleucine patch superfamily enzyme